LLKMWALCDKTVLYIFFLKLLINTL
jgi:hypothetical protein